MSTQLARLGWRQRLRYAVTGTPTIVPAEAGSDGPDATVNRRQIQMYRPPTVLDGQGHAGPGIDQELFAHYLVYSVERATGANIEGADITFTGTQGRFAGVDMTLHQWRSQLHFIVPIGMISREMKEALDLYMAGLALKAGQAHRGHQDHTQANQLFDQAQRKLEALRNDPMAHYQTDAEYMFLVAACQAAKKAAVLKSVPGTVQITDRTPVTER